MRKITNEEGFLSRINAQRVIRSLEDSVSNKGFSDGGAQLLWAIIEEINNKEYSLFVFTFDDIEEIMSCSRNEIIPNLSAFWDELKGVEFSGFKMFDKFRVIQSCNSVVSFGLNSNLVEENSYEQFKV